MITGNVKVSIDGLQYATVPVDGSGNASAVINQSVAVGNHTLTVTYTGDANNGGSVFTKQFSVTPTHHDTAVSVPDAPDAVPLGSSFSLTINVTQLN